MRLARNLLRQISHEISNLSSSSFLATSFAFKSSICKTFTLYACTIQMFATAKLYACPTLDSKRNRNYLGRITQKRVTHGRAHVRGLASEQHLSEKTSQRRLVVGDNASCYTGPRIEPHTSRNVSDVITTKLTNQSTQTDHWD